MNKKPWWLGCMTIIIMAGYFVIFVLIAMTL